MLAEVILFVENKQIFSLSQLQFSSDEEDEVHDSAPPQKNLRVMIPADAPLAEPAKIDFIPTHHIQHTTKIPPT